MFLYSRSFPALWGRCALSPTLSPTYPTTTPNNTQAPPPLPHTQQTIICHTTQNERRNTIKQSPIPLETVWNSSGQRLEIVWKLSENCLGIVLSGKSGNHLEPSGDRLEIVWKLSGKSGFCLESLETVCGNCLDRVVIIVWGMSDSYQFVHNLSLIIVSKHVVSQPKNNVGNMTLDDPDFRRPL